MKDMASGLLLKRVLSPAVGTDNTALVGQIIDRKGYEGLLFGILTGNLADADATWAVLVEHGDASNLSDAAAVDDTMLISQTSGTAPETAAAFTFAADDNVRKIGYVGDKRYVRMTITPTGNAGNAPIAAFALLGHAASRPVTQGTS